MSMAVWPSISGERPGQLHEFLQQAGREVAVERAGEKTDETDGGCRQDHCPHPLKAGANTEEGHKEDRERQDEAEK